MPQQSNSLMLQVLINALGRSAIVMMVLMSGSSSRADDSDIWLASRIVTFSTAAKPSGDPMKMNCTGTLLSAEWMLTAGHCIDSGTQSITVHCVQNSKEPELLTRTLRKVITHTNHDIALLQFEQSTHCPQPASIAEGFQQATTLAQVNRIARSLFTFSRADAARHPLVLLETNSQTYIAEDEQCLTQGDSGTPAFTAGNDNRLELAAVLIQGTSDCPSLQILANVSHFSSWVESELQGQQVPAD